MSTTDELDRIVETLLRGAENAAANHRDPGDAIDAVLAEAPRRTDVRSLRDHEALRRFRRELADESVRAETLRGFLDWLALFVETLVR